MDNSYSECKNDSTYFSPYDDIDDVERLLLHFIARSFISKEEYIRIIEQIKKEAEEEKKEKINKNFKNCILCASLFSGNLIAF